MGKGISSVLAAVLAILLIVVAALAILYASSAGGVSTVTSTETAPAHATSTLVSTSTETAISSVTATVTTFVTEGPLITYSADAYGAETEALLSGFAKATGIPTAPVISGGSNADASTIEAGAPDDVFVSAALSATAPSHLGNLSANWAIGFATDQVVVAYSNATLSDAAASAVISFGQAAERSNASSDWNAFYAALTSGGTKVGISSPIADPGGLRGWLVLDAAGYLYVGNKSAYSSALLRAQSNVTGTSSAALVAPLQSGQIQFLIIYKSAAISDGIGYISLDEHVNLSDASLASYYSQFSYTDSAGETTGAPIVLVVTVPLSSVNSAEAFEFVQYLVNSMGSLSEYGLVVPKTALLYSSLAPQSMPGPIQALLAEGLLTQAGPV